MWVQFDVTSACPKSTQCRRGVPRHIRIRGKLGRQPIRAIHPVKYLRNETVEPPSDRCKASPRRQAPSRQQNYWPAHSSSCKDDKCDGRGARAVVNIYQSTDVQAINIAERQHKSGELDTTLRFVYLFKMRDELTLLDRLLQVKALLLKTQNGVGRDTQRSRCRRRPADSKRNIFSGSSAARPPLTQSGALFELANGVFQITLLHERCSCRTFRCIDDGHRRLLRLFVGIRNLFARLGHHMRK